MVPDREEEFRTAYGPRGLWTQLFAPAPGFLGTDLIQCGESGSYLTVDRWRDETDFKGFMVAVGDEYRKIDARLSVLSVDETLVGRDTVVD